MGSKKVKKTALYGMLTALALILGYVESQVPPFFFVPGMKLGLTNVVIVLALYKMGDGSAMLLNFIRIVLSALIFSNPISMIYSLAGGMLSTIVMILLKRSGLFRMVTVSIAGGIAHNVGQIIAAMLLLQTAGIGWYLSLLWFSGIATGALIGIIGAELAKRLSKGLWEV